MKKWYAVKVGRRPGIYDSWSACKVQVDGFSGSQYKSFTIFDEARDYMGDAKRKDATTHIVGDGLLAYVDGSYNVKTKEYGYGCVFIKEQQVIGELYGKGINEEYASMRNVAGEILGCVVAINFALEKGYNEIGIYYDYEGIEKWATGSWQANTSGTQAYVKKMNALKNKIHITFIKVLAHSGDLYNERADLLAKKSVGIKK